MAQATYVSKDQNWQEESTTYWFELTGIDNGTGYEFNGETYGLVASDSDYVTVVNSDSYPLNDSDNQTIAVRNTAAITDELIAL